jgi:hypothetical protein
MGFSYNFAPGEVDRLQALVLSDTEELAQLEAELSKAAEAEEEDKVQAR